MHVLGIDIGGTGIKGAPINTETQEFLEERFRVATPKPAKPDDVIASIKEIITHFNWTGPVGIGFPTVIKNGKAMAYGNMHKSWKGLQIDHLISEKTGLDCTVINDADAAGLAEVHYGAGKNTKGLIAVITIGTGIGSGLFYNGILIPNFELGRIQYKKKPIEKYASNATRKKKKLPYKKWAKRFNFFLKNVELLCTPDQYIIGGGISKEMDQFKDYLKTDIPIVPAILKNNAGILGAALSYKHLNS